MHLQCILFFVVAVVFGVFSVFANFVFRDASIDHIRDSAHLLFAQQQVYSVFQLFSWIHVTTDDLTGPLQRWPCLLPKQLSVYCKGRKLQLLLILSFSHIISFVSNVLYSIFAFMQCRKAKGFGNTTLFLSSDVATPPVTPITELDLNLFFSFYQFVSQFNFIIYKFYDYCYLLLLSIIFCQIYYLEKAK